ncbi:hypothetical protein GCM10010174_61850 [Kutzneria viridogrisea]|uniref:Uncharacterized protein n=1 Tax=Kutzneria viridogrisea TaxID=47990 RepID=A0ABR6BG88_9PSEU|nr:hypothetical protein [Kutzneria viridogrisea]
MTTTYDGDDETFRWDSTALRDAALDCLHGRYTALHGDDRTQELLRGIGLALLAAHEQRTEWAGAVLDLLRDAKEGRT